MYLTLTCKAFSCFFHSCIETHFCLSIKYRGSNRSINVAFILKAAFVAGLVMSGFSISTSAAFVFKAAL